MPEKKAQAKRNETKPPHQNLPSLWKTFPVPQKMGKGLGEREILLKEV